MRIVIVVVGIVLIILGAVLAFVPIGQIASQDVTSNAPYAANLTGGAIAFSITGTVPLTISWTSSNSTTMIMGACDKVNLGASNISGSCTNAQITTQTGTSGSWNVNVKPGGAIVAGCATSNCKATVTVKAGYTVIGDILLILGIVLLIVGVILKSKPKAAPPMAQPMPPDNTMGGQPPMGSQ